LPQLKKRKKEESAMKWILASLVLGIFLNMSSSGGHSWPIGSVVATVLMGVYIKLNQDKHFEEIKNILEKKNAGENAHNSSSENRAD